MEYVDELVVIGGIIVGIALIFKGDTSLGYSLFATIVGYVLGRQKKVNGELIKIIKTNADKKKR